jgi:hypothetical protein
LQDLALIKITVARFVGTGSFLIYTIILFNFVVPTCSVSQQNLLPGDGCGSPNHIYLLTPRCRVLLEQLTGLHLVKKFPAFHGTPRFITALTSVRHLSLSWASPIQSIYPHPTS